MTQDNAPLLEIEDVWLSFGETPVLEGIHLSLGRGDFLGLIGPNGAGKTVLLKVILGLIQPDRGTIRIAGRVAGRMRGHGAADTHGVVAYVPQYAGFDRSFPIRVIDVVMMGRLRGSGLTRRYSAQDREKARAALGKLDLDGLADRQIGKLSGGQLQRVLIARALATDASILLLDEATSNLDTPIEGKLYELLEELSHDRAIILVSHEIGVISKHINSIACINRKLHYHRSNELTPEMIEQTYGTSMDLVVHGHAHRVLETHE